MLFNPVTMEVAVPLGQREEASTEYLARWVVFEVLTG